MPMYEYECRAHGTFEAIASIAACREPAACPTCDVVSSRVLSVPHFSSMPRSEIIARDRNERSRHEPRISSTPGACSHAGPCNHGSRGKPKAKPGQLQAYKGKRPWVMEHA